MRGFGYAAQKGTPFEARDGHESRERILTKDRTRGFICTCGKHLLSQNAVHQANFQVQHNHATDRRVRQVASSDLRSKLGFPANLRKLLASLLHQRVTTDTGQPFGTMSSMYVQCRANQITATSATTPLSRLTHAKDMQSGQGFCACGVKLNHVPWPMISMSREHSFQVPGHGFLQCEDPTARRTCPCHNSFASCICRCDFV